MSRFLKAKSWLSTLSDSDIGSIVSQINTEGIYSAPEFLSKDELLHMQEFVSAAIEKAGNKTVSLKKDEASDTRLNELVDSSEFSDFIFRLYSTGFGTPPPNLDCYQILRCLTGESAAAHSWKFHYDSYMITALVPIVVPSKGMRGDFLIIPNTRHMRSSYALNLLDKVLLDNALTQKMLRRRISDGQRVKRISLTPGNLYLFWGYRSIHTNEAVDDEMVRATVLFHYADPHTGSFLKRQLGRA
ncbi:hypothetical protein [Roseibium marinum]|uniref:Uncharacterized protein n=1 Tax=Roseibium marinum TaxID=281252 RepID=A0A2S3UTR7_9HYPH|nr:hypothetical protein [Roseibium marinum]POF31076.1 hypothetical protein CLV41_105256 [Roseibium marinum]